MKTFVANVVVEIAKDGFYSCYCKEEFEDFALFGYGESASKAKEDLLSSYKEIQETLVEEGKEPIEIDFVWHYDMKSFFDYFDFLNVSKVAERAGINPSLMRKYTSGVANAGEKQYLKLRTAVKEFSAELLAAEF
ncbi:MAG: pilus assembly protein HicB [Bacteroidales bacterium]|nr:pilus assembly protein HicB [Bacteroidales bacterium]